MRGESGTHTRFAAVLSSVLVAHGTCAVAHPGSLAADLDELEQLVRARLRGRPARVFLFGSAARGEAGRTADLDLAVLPVGPLPIGLLAELREAVEDSGLVRRVDVVDLSQASPDLCRWLEELQRRTA